MINSRVLGEKIGFATILTSRLFATRPFSVKVTIFLHSLLVLLWHVDAAGSRDPRFWLGCVEWIHLAHGTRTSVLKRVMRPLLAVGRVATRSSSRAMTRRARPRRSAAWASISTVAMVAFSTSAAASTVVTVTRSPSITTSRATTARTSSSLMTPTTAITSMFMTILIKLLRNNRTLKHTESVNNDTKRPCQTPYSTYLRSIWIRRRWRAHQSSTWLAR